jgi:glycosyltransferase involved in cell wall biosynthesis
MKILIIGGSFSLTNGYTNAVVSIAKTLAKKEDVSVLPLFAAKDENNYKIYRDVTILSKKLSIYDMPRIAKTFKESLELIRRYSNPLHINGMLYLLQDMSNRCVLEKVICKINPDVVHVHGVILDTWPFVETLLKKNIPFCVTIHAFSSHDPNVKVGYDSTFEKDAIKVLIYENIPISVVSQGIKDDIQREIFVPPGAITVIPNGVDTKRFAPNDHPNRNVVRDMYHLPHDKMLILQVGTLCKRKNQIAVLNAIAKMPESLRNHIHFVIVGDGEERLDLINFCEMEKILEKCTFVGRVVDSELECLYLASDMYILPSTSEGLALVSLEAMAAGLPIITFDSLEGMKEIYHPEIMQLIPGRDVMSIIHSIKTAVDKRWDRKKIRNYANKWSWEKSCKGYLHIYKQTIVGASNRKLKNVR